MLGIARGAFVSSLIVVLSACAAVDGEPKPAAAESDVVDGRPRAADEYRSVGLLVGQVGLCTGTLVAPQIVLTASHCSKIAPASFCVEGPDGNDCAPTDFARDVPEEWRGPEYCPSGGDMRLVHLAKPITSVAPFALDDVQVSVDATCDVVGFGGSDAEHLEATVGRLRIVGIDDGSAVNAVGVEGGGHTDVGDSGGPVICGGKLAAITSCGAPGSNAGYYVATHPFHAWLHQTMADWSRPAECARFDMRCEQAAGRDELWQCDDFGHWALGRACPAGHCYFTGDTAGCPD